MDIKIIVGLISLSGVLVSALISLIVSRNKIKSEVEKLRYEMHLNFSEKIMEYRLSVFPDAYFEVETYVKAIQNRSLDYNKYCKHYDTLNEWHSKNGYILSSASNRVFYSYLRKSKRITERSEEAFNNRISDATKRRELIREAWEIELSLKNDLGIFRIEYFDPDQMFKTYEEIDEKLEKENS